MLVRLIIIAAILFGGMHFYQQYQKDKTLNELSQPVYSSNSVAKSQATSAPATEPTFACDGRQHCSQMNSLEEAKFFIKNCPNTKMDGDNDGEPCENDSRLR